MPTRVGHEVLSDEQFQYEIFTPEIELSTARHVSINEGGYGVAKTISAHELCREHCDYDIYFSRSSLEHFGAADTEDVSGKKCCTCGVPSSIFSNSLPSLKYSIFIPI